MIRYFRPREITTKDLPQHLLRLAEQVATSGEKVNIADCLEVEKGSGGNVRSLMAMPIRNPNYQVIGKLEY